MTQLINTKDLEDLISHQDTPAVSIFIPTDPTDPTHDKDRILIKNALSETEPALIEHFSKDEIEAFLQPVRALQNDDAFWSQIQQGLALFIGPDFFKAFHLPEPVNARVVVNSHFHLPPLVPYLENREQLTLVAFSQKQVRCFRVDSHSIQRIENTELPTSLEHFLRFDQFESQLQHHGAEGGGQDTIYHGHGEEGYTHEQQLIDFSKAIAKGLQPLRRNEDHPVILACVDELYGIIKQHTALPVHDQYLSGNPDRWSAQDIHEKLKNEMPELLKTHHQVAVERLQDIQHTAQAETDATKVASAAYNSRVDTLFVLQEEGARGLFNQETAQVEVLAGGVPHAEDLINLATTHTLRNGGQVIALEPSEVEGATQLAAILRY